METIRCPYIYANGEQCPTEDTLTREKAGPGFRWYEVVPGLLLCRFNHLADLLIGRGWLAARQ